MPCLSVASKSPSSNSITWQSQYVPLSSTKHVKAMKRRDELKVEGRIKRLDPVKAE